MPDKMTALRAALAESVRKTHERYPDLTREDVDDALRWMLDVSRTVIVNSGGGGLRVVPKEDTHPWEPPNGP